MGLLDLDSDTLLSGLLSAGAASGAKGNYLARVAAGLATGERFKQGRAEQARQRSQDEMQAEYKQLMMQKMKMDAEREQRADTQGQTNNAAVLAGLSGGDFDPASFLQKNPGANVSALEQVMKTRQMMQPKTAEFSTTPQADQNGRMYVIADDGSMKYLDGVKARDPLKEVRLGDKIGFRTDFSPEIAGAIPLGQSPDSRASTAAMLRGQDLTNARARERLALDQGNAVAESGGPSQAAFAKQFGKPSPGYRWKADGSQEFIPGGPADQKAMLQKSGEGTVGSVVADLRDKYKQLSEGGGIVDEDQGAFSNIGAAIGASGIGQTLGGAVGTKNQTARDSIAMTRPLLLQAIMKATGMSAKQMDSNAELKLYLATATDPQKGLKANQEALDRIEALYGGGAQEANPAALKPKSNGWSIQKE